MFQSTFRKLEPFLILFRQSKFIIFLELCYLFLCSTLKKNHFPLFIELIYDFFQFF